MVLRMRHGLLLPWFFDKYYVATITNPEVIFLFFEFLQGIIQHSGLHM